MIRFIYSFLIFSICCSCLLSTAAPLQSKTDSVIIVPLGGNAWRSVEDTSGGDIKNQGIVNWTNSKTHFTAYVRFHKTGHIKLSLKLKVNDGESKLAVSALRRSKSISVKAGDFKEYAVGDWAISDTGYVAFKISGVSKTGKIFADVESMTISGSALDAKTAFVKNNDGEYFHWGRRGPSVHLNYTIPDKTNAEWFYNEVTVPKGNDVVGSYFMADGFGEGYFGMQVNSTTERRILFSVWSPFKTDDPGKIPADQKINLLKKGDRVHTGEFGNEGSGGQSYLQYNWKAGNTYKFLIHAKPDQQNRTTYTAYFWAPEESKWQLIASFSRPQTSTYLKHLHSFLENFEPEAGEKTRKVLFTNQWLCDDTGKWIPLEKAKFTIDQTGVKGYRMDYAGGVEGNAFYLKNCGFFNNYIPRSAIFERTPANDHPNIDFQLMP